MHLRMIDGTLHPGAYFVISSIEPIIRKPALDIFPDVQMKPFIIIVVR
jgi:hypothetical protein